MEGPQLGCTSQTQIVADARRLADALSARVGGRWEWSTGAGASTAVPLDPAVADAERIFAVVSAVFPEVVLGPLDATRGCRPLRFSTTLDERTGREACVEVADGLVRNVHIDRDRRLDAFAPMLVVREKAADEIAERHARDVLHRVDAHPSITQIQMRCEGERATSLVWEVNVHVSRLHGDIIFVDATSGEVLETRETSSPH